MKANEIMIGDLVSYRGIVNRVAPADFCQKAWIEEIKPIPLTPEILEKNGWVKDLYSFEGYDNEELECLSLWVGEDGKNKWWWRVGVELVTPINYVHELQHALRLCRIQKEIIL